MAPTIEEGGLPRESPRLAGRVQPFGEAVEDSVAFYLGLCALVKMLGPKLSRRAGFPNAG